MIEYDDVNVRFKCVHLCSPETINKKDIVLSTKPVKNNDNQVNVGEINLKDIKIGYVMPIAKTEGYPDSHWLDVVNIIDDTIIGMGIKKGRMVSDGGEITTIHSRIVNNLNDDDLIICDVSSRNPNVMFELGMRIAFDKPVLIIKDDATDYCFDSGTIEHIGYPKDLRHGLINKFQDKLEDKIKQTYESYLKHKDKKTSPILKSFGAFERSEIQLDDVSANELLVQDIQVIKDTLVRLQMNITDTKRNSDNILASRPSFLVKSSGDNTSINLKRIRPSRREYLLGWLKENGFEFNVNNESGILNIHDVGMKSHEIINEFVVGLI